MTPPPREQAALEFENKFSLSRARVERRVESAATRHSTLGTGVQASPSVLPDCAELGHSYDLPRLHILKTGTEAYHYAVHVQRLTQGGQRHVPAGWIGGGREDIPLAPAQSTTIPLTLTVPVDAAPGEYVTNLVAGTTAPSISSGAAVGAAAVAEVRF